MTHISEEITGCRLFHKYININIDFSKIIKLCKKKLFKLGFCFFFSTDLMIQQTIRSTFAKYTVLTIAHRLHTVIDSDRILIIDDGKLIEFETPYTLITKETSMFCQMCKALGTDEFNRLLMISSVAYKNQGNDARQNNFDR